MRRWVSRSNPTIFLRVCFPGLPTLSQVRPVYSRHSLSEPLTHVQCLPSIHFRHRAQQYVFVPSIHKAIPLFLPILPTALSVCIISNYQPKSNFPKSINGRFRIRKKNKKESKVLLSGKMR